MSLLFNLSASIDRFRGFFSYIPERFSSFGWTDALDILYLSAILFFLIVFMRDRQLGGAVVGILVWSAIYGLSCLLDLTAVKTLLGSFFSIGVIAIVILFHSEIREMLGRIGTDSFRNIRSTLSSEKQHKQNVYDESIDAIAQAVSELSRLKTGALIVFERNDQLSDIVRSGIEIDAKVTSYLIRNIFFDKSPLHDGAVVIRERRLCAAGCLLPLSRRSDLSQSFGTRHRAAIGMSENSDALIVIVSEETGIISVAYRRRIRRNFNYTTLKNFLYRVMFNLGDVDAEGEVEEKNETAEQEEIYEE